LFLFIFFFIASGPSPPGDVVGKVSVGYQGWFAATGDGSPINDWWHWANDWSKAPSPTNVGIKSWPDVRSYTSTYKTAFNNLNNGEPATLFSSFNDQTVNTHFAWLQKKRYRRCGFTTFQSKWG